MSLKYEIFPSHNQIIIKIDSYPNYSHFVKINTNESNGMDKK